MKRSVLMSVALGLSVAAAQAQDKLIVDGSTTVGPIAKAFAEVIMRQNPGVNITVSESGSGNGAKALLNGTCDVACLSRNLKDSERKAMDEKGVKPVVHVVAFDALPVIVHPSNPVKGLTIDQVRDIYTGKITNWKDVGGADQRIVVISRDTNSGTYETFKDLVLGKDNKIIASAEYTGSNGGMRQRVQMTRGAIGYAGLGFVDRTIKALEINGVMPSAETVSAKQYPLSRELYLFTNGEPAADTLAGKFLSMSRTEKGREIIEEIGFVPVPDAK
ncbi:MAG TPA: phosphate ABC transporter substrate-binding protein [Kiritimatiellia bacterium]|jgi:phosphate transport system substrate-binding protein|nr:phosphate ABC transporter substrate-binding protein [Kiritimatiellia bacterium]